MSLDMYQHDSAEMFQFILRGELSAGHVPDLEHAWTTAQSIVESKQVVLDLSGVTDADPSGIDLLRRMRDSGVRLSADRPVVSETLLKSLSIPAPKAAPRQRAGWIGRFWGLARPRKSAAKR